MKRLIPLLLLLLTAMPVMAQTTTVTGTIVDPNGNPYASGTASAQKSVATGQVQPPPVNVTTNGSGTFSMTLLSPASYIFTVCAPPTQIGPTGNPTPVTVCFSNSTPISISGASQDVSGSLNPVAKILGPNITGVSGVVSVGVAGQLAQYAVNGNVVSGTTTVPYSYLTSFPAACPVNQVAVQVGATLGCASLTTSYLPLSGTWAFVGTLSGNVTFTGVDTLKNLNAVVYVDAANVSGWAGTSVDGYIASASAALGGSGGTVHINSGAYTINATIQGVTNVTIECDLSQQAVLTASASLNAPLVHFNGVNHAGITNCKLDGNLSNNANSNDLIRVTNSQHINTDHNWLRNTIGNGIYLRTASAWIDITRNEIEHLGPALPLATAAITSDSAAAVAIVHVKITDNKIHDGNLGIYVQPAVAGTTTFDWEIAHNRIWAMANDPMAIFSANSSGSGAVVGLRFADNDSECSGWPANGTLFDPFCTAGFRQTGAVASSSGSGLDLNSANIEEISATGNNLSHNFFEGLDSTPQRITTVNTNGTTVTYVSGDPFLCASWKANQGLQITGINYLVSVCNGATTTITLTGSAGVQNGVTLIGPGNSRNVISQNIACDNGHGNSSTSGAGFATFSIGDKFSTNTACRNNAPGFVDSKSAFVSHSADVAYNNNLSGAANGNFLAQSALKPSYHGVSTDGNAYGIVWDGQVNGAFAQSANITGSTGTVNDLGTADAYEVGQLRVGQLTFGTAGAYSLNGGSPGGTFSSTLPPSNGILLGTGNSTTYKSVVGQPVGCTTAAAIGANCTGTAITWPGTGFADTSYSVSCQLTAITNQPHIVSISKATGSVQIVIAADTATAATGSVDCQAVHQ